MIACSLPETMRLRRPPLLRLLLLLGIAVPALAWAIVKPVRVVVPRVAPVTCSASVCVDVEAKAAEAHLLLARARSDVEAKLGPLQHAPTMFFCATQACADYFGLGARSAVTLGTVATVIGPRAWKPYYVRHELIHHAQGDHIGVLPLLWQPGWVKEGMPYALSGDPRAPLAEPFETQRREFLSWYAGIDPRRIWMELGAR